MTEQTKKVDPEVTPENPIKIKRVQKNDIGGVDYVFSLDYTQTYFLLDFAIRFLITQGLVQIEDAIAEEPKEGDAPRPAVSEDTIILDKRLH